MNQKGSSVKRKAKHQRPALLLSSDDDISDVVAHRSSSSKSKTKSNIDRPRKRAKRRKRRANTIASDDDDEEIVDSDENDDDNEEDDDNNDRDASDGESEDEDRALVESLVAKCESFTSALSLGNDADDNSTSNRAIVTQPRLVPVKLRNYQLVGLNWLALLYEKQLNGDFD